MWHACLGAGEVERLEDDELLIDVHTQFCNLGAYSPAYSTLCHALAAELNYSMKRERGLLSNPSRAPCTRPAPSRLEPSAPVLQLTALARERDEVKCLQWKNQLRLMISPEQLVCVDES